MKRYIRSDTELNILRQLANKLKSEGKDAKVNRDHKCVDVFDENGNITEQHYAEETGKVDSFRVRYEYKGPNRGDYVQVRYPIKQKDYSLTDTHLIKNIKFTNRDKTKRR